MKTRIYAAPAVEGLNNKIIKYSHDLFYKIPGQSSTVNVPDNWNDLRAN